VRTGQVRIIGGTHRRRLLRFPDRPGLRPTPDRVRETLFNWLGQELTGRRALDLFAGSGALGLEAASRGASEVVLIDSDRQAVEALRENVRSLGLDRVEVLRGDALEFLRSDRREFDVVFADPPFAEADPPRLLEQVASHLARQGVVYMETPGEMPVVVGWSVLRRLRAGNVHAHLLQKADP
jgi:16S rRNA (guanine(966)-N(2))-methyltransferase RsmD